METKTFTMKVKRQKSRAHRVLFDQDLPFTPKSVMAKNKYQRRAKHRLRGFGENDESGL